LHLTQSIAKWTRVVVTEVSGGGSDESCGCIDQLAGFIQVTSAAVFGQTCTAATVNRSTA
jgi:hypothetical protein